MNSGETNNKPPVCESCGQGFSCGARTGENVCWCFEVNSNPETLAALAREFSDCLCPNCLLKKLELLLPRQSASTPAVEN